MKRIIFLFIPLMIYFSIDAFFLKNYREDSYMISYFQEMFGLIKTREVRGANSEFIIDIHLSENVIRVFNNNRKIKEIECKNERSISSAAELAVGVFTVEDKVIVNKHNKDKEYESYYLKFFENSIIQSVLVNEKGNIIEEDYDNEMLAINKIKISQSDGRWMMNNIPKGTAVFLHY